LLYQEEEAEQIWIWASDWAESLVEFDPTWLNWWQVTNSMVEFPVNLAPLEPNPNQMAQHDAVTIAQFLSELRTNLQ
jgi:hypothetical protein